jgi:competence protein ComEC
VALTHAHHDHIDGLHAVLQNFTVGELWVGRDEETETYRSLLAEAKARGVTIVHKEQGNEFDWDGVRGDVLWPPQEAAAAEASNDDSLVMRITDASTNFVLPGDAEQSVENQLADNHLPLAAEFLKVPHHGSKTSSTEKFLEAVGPKVAVVSVGDSNPYGHPAQSVVERYAQDGIRLLRTDRDGAVTTVSDGKSLSVHSYVQGHPR